MAPLSKWIDSLPAGGRVSDAAQVSIEARLATVAYWLPLAARQIDDDIEKVHQLRVATRRAIAALVLYDDWIPPNEARWFEKRLKKIRRAAGVARDLDVLAKWIRQEVGCDAGRLLARLASERASAQPKIMSIADRCENKNRFSRRMYRLLAEMRPRGKACKKQDVSFHSWAEMQLTQVSGSFFAIQPYQNIDLSALHEFRISGKKLRYTLELLAPAFGPELRKQWYPIVEELQEKLGRINDCVAADESLRRWALEVDSTDEKVILEQLAEKCRHELREAIADFRHWWTREHSQSLQRGLGGAILTDNHAIDATASAPTSQLTAELS